MHPRGVQIVEAEPVEDEVLPPQRGIARPQEGVPAGLIVRILEAAPDVDQALRGDDDTGRQPRGRGDGDRPDQCGHGPRVAVEDREQGAQHSDDVNHGVLAPLINGGRVAPSNSRLRPFCDPAAPALAQHVHQETPRLGGELLCVRRA